MCKWSSWWSDVAYSYDRFPNLDLRCCWNFRDELGDIFCLDLSVYWTCHGRVGKYGNQCYLESWPRSATKRRSYTKAQRYKRVQSFPHRLIHIATLTSPFVLVKQRTNVFRHFNMLPLSALGIPSLMAVIQAQSFGLDCIKCPSACNNDCYAIYIARVARHF